MKISFISTVFNEGQTVSELLDSVLAQTKLPDEVIIVDGESSDGTLKRITDYGLRFKKKRVRFVWFVKKGNRSVGRNAAIKKATGDIIVVSDAGCVLDKNWVKHITDPFMKKNADVIAGYYKGNAINSFQRSLIPYVLVMPNKVNPSTFLPASRSMAFRKSIWKKVGGFDERYSHNEDYVFAKQLHKLKATIFFEKKAVVLWKPRSNFVHSFWMFFRFALGDIEALIFRPRVGLLFLRYFLYGYLFFLDILYRSFYLTTILVVLPIFYLLWSVKKNYQYVKHPKACIHLPMLQITADMAVMCGSLIGLLKHLRFRTLVSAIKKNKTVTWLIASYIIMMMSLINWGIPNPQHPFAYFMDEWHQLQAVRTVFTQGTANIEGSANGPMFQFFLNGIYLAPFILLKIVNISAITSSVDALDVQQRLFQILRLNTLLFGVSSIVMFTYIVKKYFRLHPALPAFLFVVNPLWLSLSNYFKYDIALTFWLLLCFLFFIRFAQMPSLSRFVFLGVLCGMILAVKISAVPLVIIYILTFFFFFPHARGNLKTLGLGVLAFACIFVILGIPDLVFGKGNMFEYLDSVLRRTPQAEAENTKLGMHYFLYFLTKTYPLTFGHALYFSFVLSVIAIVAGFVNELRKRKNSFKNIFQKHPHLVLTGLFVLFFGLSILLLRFEGRGNRLLPLLPFVVLAVSFYITKFSRHFSSGFRIAYYAFVGFLCFLQSFASFFWVSPKLHPDPREISSKWIKQNIPVRSSIAIENIPIYQMLPDILLKDFYIQKQKNTTGRYQYEVFTTETNVIPPYVVLTNQDFAQKYLKTSIEENGLTLISKKHYKKIFEVRWNNAFPTLIANEREIEVSGLIFFPHTIAIYERDYQ